MSENPPRMERPVEHDHDQERRDQARGALTWPELEARGGLEPLLTRPAPTVRPPHRKGPPSRGALVVGVVLLALAALGVWTTVREDPQRDASGAVAVSGAEAGEALGLDLLRDLGERQYAAGEHAGAYRTFQRLLAVAPGDVVAARYIETLERWMVVVRSEPSGAAVFRGDVRLGRAPVGLFPAGDDPVRLRLEVPGRAPREVEISPDTRGEVVFEIPAS
ncbi:MAG: hypothetical protein ACQEXJ_14585 [Myxococcota bacterium]